MKEFASNVHKRCTWLGANVYGNKNAIDNEAMAALSSIDFGRAMEMTKELEEKGTSISNPSGYLKAAVKRELGGGKGGGRRGVQASRDVDEDTYSGVHKRCKWLGANVFGDKDAIDLEAVSALSSISFGRAMEITKDLEEKGEGISNPSGYLKNAVKCELGRQGSKGAGTSGVVVVEVDPKTFSNVHKRCTWLGSNVFGDKDAIDQEAVGALASLSFGRAMELTKELEEKGRKISNPSGYLKAAVSRESNGGKASGKNGDSGSRGVGRGISHAIGAAPRGDDGQAFSSVHKRCRWLGANIFGDKDAIDQEAIAALASISFGRAMEMTKQLEEKGSAVSNPSGFLKVAVKRELGDMGDRPSKRRKT